jgi:hypothetical protein
LKFEIKPDNLFKTKDDQFQAEGRRANVKIDLKKNPRPGSEYPNLVVDGIVDRDSFVFGKKGKPLYARVYSTRVARKLMQLTLRELETIFSNINLPYRVEWNAYFDSVHVDFRVFRDKTFPSIDIELQPNWEEWARPYSIAEYADVLERVIKSRNESVGEFFQSDELISSGFGLRQRISSSEAMVRDEIRRCVSGLHDVCEEAETILISSSRNNAVTTFFTFPTEIRTACEQYLLYFIQFLDDLGIKAAAEIKEDAQRVLFSVTPADGATALRQVREALDVYLRLPTMKDLATMQSSSSDVAVQQLQANVLHLRSQLALAEATLTAKNATIEALQMSNFQYRQLLSSEKTTNREQEKLISDIVYLTPIQTKGIKVDLPSLLRHLKRRFGREKTKQLLPPARKQ